MKKVIDKSDSRGHSLYDWLDSYHTFSFDEYYNPRRMNFGALRVLNDDRVAPGKGFGTHPHKNMEIISKEGKKINTYKPSGQKEEDSGKRGRKVGIAYELDNGEIIYVPE